MATKTTDLIDEVVRDHAEIRALFAKVEASNGTSRSEAFGKLMHKLVVHETAEQEVVHPLAEKAHAKQIADARRTEEKKGEKGLSELVEIGPENPDFETKLATLKQEVLAHAEREEHEEHPKIRESVEGERLSKLAGVYRAAESTAPTRPHPGSPTSAGGKLAMGPLLSVMDRTRDAIHQAKKRLG